MEVDKRVKKLLEKNLLKWRDEIVWIIDNQINNMKKVNSVEELTSIKRNLLIEYVSRMPLDRATCYFCLKNKNCRECEYGKVHGICFDDGSTYDKIISAKNRLIAELLKYYQGETYE